MSENSQFEVVGYDRSAVDLILGQLGAAVAKIHGVLQFRGRTDNPGRGRGVGQN
jgi:hypothetical protein